MHRVMPLLSFLALAACSAGNADDSAPLKGGDTCVALVSGTWTFAGAAFGMGTSTMTGEVDLDAAACTFALSNWDMQMDDLPSGGVLDGDTVTLDGLTSYWRSCTGTATDDMNVSGSCSDDGSAWSMVAISEG
jgi:hypothetical protein